ncbi:peptidoglycan editing factor PgeF [Clostridium paraputrificum]|uniref:peptidoglycan editing factor PgeF n=1 Tax=Clostridium TaxID=1485 RepID=UPI003D350DE0
MNKLNVGSLSKYKDYLVIDGENEKLVFSTAEKGRNFNRHTEDGIRTIESIKEEFNVEDIIYLRQVHSDRVLIFKGDNREEFIEEEGDSLITNIKNIAIGVFTADCVPVILVDEAKGVAAAIHSGWKGTFNSITKKTIEKMQNVYGSQSSDIKAYIGGHIRQCCYEVSEELKSKFINEKNIDENILFNGRNLSMEECIIDNLKEVGIKDDNINSLSLCTYCSEDIKLHSYRKSEGSYGRLFSFVILK